MQTISGRIFELLKEQNMSQKKFAQETGIAESTISDWKKKKTCKRKFWDIWKH